MLKIENNIYNSKVNVMDDNNITKAFLNKRKKYELLSLCKELKISDVSKLKKFELIEIIYNSVKDNNNPGVGLNNSKLKFIDLFCGIGGFHQALSKLDFECVMASDIDKTCREVYDKNYKLKPNGDITNLNIKKIPKFDILCGGFPCQPFSKAGNQKGFDDDRGNLFFNICKIVEHHRPKFIILENVRNLSSHDNGNTWKVIYESLDKLGYYTYKQPVILNVLHFNIPQNRERVIIMCKRKDLGNLPELPKIDKHPKNNLTNILSNYIIDDIKENKKYIISNKFLSVKNIWNNFIKILIKNNISIPKYPIWTDWWDNKFENTEPFYLKYKNWIDKNRLFYTSNKKILSKWLKKSREDNNWVGAVRKFEWQAGDLSKNDSMETILWTPRGSGIRTKRPDYIPTLVAMSMVPYYGPKNRKLSPKELLSLQSFPIDFKYIDEKSLYKQLGNAVNVTMIERCARFLIKNENLFI